MTPLHVACMKGHMEIVKCLVARLDVESYDSSLKIAIRNAKRKGHSDIVKYLKEISHGSKKRYSD